MKCICIAKWISPFLLSIHFRMHSFGRIQTWIALWLPTNKNTMMLEYFVWMCVKRRIILIFNFPRCHYFWLDDWNKRNMERKYQICMIFTFFIFHYCCKRAYSFVTLFDRPRFIQYVSFDWLAIFVCRLHSLIIYKSIHSVFTEYSILKCFDVYLMYDFIVCFNLTLIINLLSINNVCTYKEISTWFWLQMIFFSWVYNQIFFCVVKKTKFIKKTLVVNS